MENEKILYKNKTIYNKENCKNFVRFILLQYNKFKYWATIILSTLFLITCIIGGIKQIIRFQKIPNTTTLFFILFFTSIIITMIKLAKGNVKIKDNLKDIIYKYDFSDDYLLISTELSTQKILYADLKNIQNVCNTEKYMYIMFTKRTGYIIDKSGFNNYNEQEFKNYMKNKFRSKYIDYLDTKKNKSYTTKDMMASIVIFLIFLQIFMVVILG